MTEFLDAACRCSPRSPAALSVSDRFSGFTRGVIAARDIVFFATFIGFFLFVNAVVLDHRKAD